MVDPPADRHGAATMYRAFPRASGTLERIHIDMPAIDARQAPRLQQLTGGGDGGVQRCAMAVFEQQVQAKASGPSWHRRRHRPHYCYLRVLPDQVYFEFAQHFQSALLDGAFGAQQGHIGIRRQPVLLPLLQYRVDERAISARNESREPGMLRMQRLYQHLSGVLGAPGPPGNPNQQLEPLPL